MTGPSARRWTVLAVLAAAAVLALGVPGPAQAHTTLIGQSPKSGASVHAPSKVTLTFADRVIQPGVVVRGPSGRRVDTATTSDGPKVTARLAASLPAGGYLVGWRVVASDGHVQTGEFRFTVAGNGAVAPPAPSSSPAPVASPGNRASGLWWVGGGLIALLVIVGAVLAVRRVAR